ncbi:MAG: hypothetical protein Q9204_001938 [Flavoplaca sp. TL-2023a]
MGNFFLLSSIARRPLCDSIDEKSKSAYGILHCVLKLEDPLLILEAGLTKVNIALVHENDWWSLNESLSDRLWDGIKTEQGMVALPKAFTDSKGLPRGVTFPWDEQRSVYFLQAYHTLHCLKMLQIAIREARHHHRQSQNYWHLAHCLDSLRQDAMCTADDTPRALKAPPHGSTGDGLVRDCRDFEQLEVWAETRTACYTFPTDDQFQDPLETRFQQCPDGSEYLPAIKKYLKSGKDRDKETYLSTN